MRKTLIALWAAALIAALISTGCSGQTGRPGRQREATQSGGYGQGRVPSQQESPATEPSPASFYDDLRDAGYGDWGFSPGYSERQPSRGPHGEEVRIRVNDVAAEALESGAAQWPDGSIIAKEIYTGGEMTQLAAMEKRDGTWYWGEWEANGQPVVEEGSEIQPCQGCHTGTQGNSDGTLAVQLRR